MEVRTNSEQKDDLIMNIFGCNIDKLNIKNKISFTIHNNDIYNILYEDTNLFKEAIQLIYDYIIDQYVIAYEIYIEDSLRYKIKIRINNNPEIIFLLEIHLNFNKFIGYHLRCYSLKNNIFSEICKNAYNDQYSYIRLSSYIRQSFYILNIMNAFMREHYNEEVFNSVYNYCNHECDYIYNDNVVCENERFDTHIQDKWTNKGAISDGVVSKRRYVIHDHDMFVVMTEFMKIVINAISQIFLVR